MNYTLWTRMKKPSKLDFWKQKAAELKIQTYALYLACRDPKTPWFAKGFTLLVVAYAFSPIDLIPDFIPIIGYLDDLVIIPLGVVLAVKMIPEPVMKACQARARVMTAQETPHSTLLYVLFLGVWAAVLLLAGVGVWALFRK